MNLLNPFYWWSPWLKLWQPRKVSVPVPVPALVIIVVRVEQ